MNLKMYLGNNLIDVVNFEKNIKISTGYIETIKMNLEEKHEDIIDLTEEEPVYFIDNVPSSMNRSLWTN